ELIERAVGRAPTEAHVDRRALDELVRIHDATGNDAQVARARRLRLKFVSDPVAQAYELRALAQLAERLGDVDQAIADVQRAIASDPSDVTLVETLDRLLARGGKDEQRVALWLTEAARTEEGTKRARSLTRAAQISENELSRPADAIKHLRSAWIAA